MNSLIVYLFLTSKLRIGRWKLGITAAWGDLHFALLLFQKIKEAPPEKNKEKNIANETDKTILLILKNRLNLL